MQKFFVLFVLGLLIFSVGCHSPTYNANFFDPWGLEGGVAGAKASWGSYSNILLVCIYEDHWEDRGPNRYSLHHEIGTVVKVYKGDWRVSEEISLVQGLDYRAPVETNKEAGNLWFVFTDQHTNSEIALDTGDYTGYDADLEPALEYIYPQKNVR
jgi:hypothetical protein